MGTEENIINREPLFEVAKCYTLVHSAVLIANCTACSCETCDTDKQNHWWQYNLPAVPLTLPVV
jgi:hypothetical protein